MGGFGSGRVAQPALTHLANGTFRASRHLNPLALQAAGEPTKPRGLNKDESWMWDQVVTAWKGANILASLDTAICRACCEQWGLYCASLKIAKTDPVDKDARIAVTSYYRAWELAARKLGLNPVDRGRLKPTPQDKPTIKSRDRA